MVSQFTSVKSKALTVILDSILSFRTYINNISCTTFFHLHNISRLHPFRMQYSNQVLIHVLFISCIIMVFLTGLKQLQIIQNFAARIITHTKSPNHETLHSSFSFSSRLKSDMTQVEMFMGEVMFSSFIHIRLVPFTRPDSLWGLKTTTRKYINKGLHNLECTVLQIISLHFKGIHALRFIHFRSKEFNLKCKNV